MFRIVLTVKLFSESLRVAFSAMAAMSRTYEQMCPIARSLDVVGERWTLLIVRELLLGPKRFKDLLAELPRMGTNRLSDRLAALERDGLIVRRTLPAPGGARVYELTERGEGLRVPVVALAQWGARLPLDERLDPSTARAVLLALVRCATAPPDAISAAREIYDLAIGDERFHILAGGGVALPRSGPSPVAPDVSMACDLTTLLELDGGTISAATSQAEGRLELEGPTDAATRLLTIMRRST
jgi:DNA-binding HxlR family transcriptional regulator